MNYRPDPERLNLWDTWLFPDPDGRQMHLFFLLANTEQGRHWDKVGHAVSEDLVHWKELPPIQVRRPEDSYYVGRIGTGMVIASPGGGFIMSYTANIGGPKQGISFLHSNDLIHWEKRWPEPRMFAQPPHYETDDTKCAWLPPAFRDAYIHRAGDGYEALIGAFCTRGEPLLRGCVARYRCKDNEFYEWEPMPPLIGPDVTMLMEVPEHFEIGHKHYLIWSTGSTLGVQCETPRRGITFGTYYAMAEEYEGPYICPDENLLVGAGNLTGESSIYAHSYVGRTMMWQNERLLYHHMCHNYPSFALPKRIVSQPDGTLQLRYWPGIEAIHKRTLSLSFNTIVPQGCNIHVGDWQCLTNNSVRGAIGGGPSLGVIKDGLPSDLHLRCKVTAETARRFGITLRDHGNIPAPGALKGVALQADLEHGAWQFGHPHHPPYSGCSNILKMESIIEPVETGQTYQLDLFVRDIYFEAYVNGIWKFSRVICHNAHEGGIGFFVDNGSARFEDIEIWELEPMLHPYPRKTD